MVISKNTVKFFIVSFIALFSLTAIANTEKDSVQIKTSSAKETHTYQDPKEKIDAFIEHHLQDSHSFIFFSDKEDKKHYGFSLPIILIDNGLVIFSSSKLSNDGIAQINNNYYKLHHGKIYKTDAQGTIAYDEHHHPINKKPLDFSITKNVVSMLLTSILLLIFFIGMAKSYQKGSIPTGFGRFLEPLILFIRDEIAIPNIGEKKYRKFMGYLLTVFFFIWLLNLLGMTPLGINVTGNIAITACLAVFTYIVTQFSGNKDYWKHIFWMPGVPVPMKIILMPIELLGTLTKPFALLIRLFANITAGHVIVMSLIAMIFIGRNIYIIEILVAFLQAFIFTMLSSLFIGMAVQDHH